MTLPFQPGILAALPSAARYLSFRLRGASDPRPALEALARRPLGDGTVVGLGGLVVRRLGCTVEGLRELPALVGPGVNSPSTPGAVWCWLRGEDPGELLHRGRSLADLLDPAFELEQAMPAFVHAGGRDLSGYEDGTENPTAEAAIEAAFVTGRGPGLDGSSFVAAQQWVHDLTRLESYSESERDDMIGRRLSDNEEFEGSPASAHVKRTAQESFEPEAFVLRRSMPWSEGAEGGLMFVAFGRALDAFEAQLRRMLGLEDEITDALFHFTRPVTGASYWCPPVDQDGTLDLSAVGV